MKRFSLFASIAIVVFAACNKNTSNKEEATEPETAVLQRQCASYEVLQEQLKADPGLAARMEAIEKFTRKLSDAQKGLLVQMCNAGFMSSSDHIGRFYNDQGDFQIPEV